MTIPSGDDVDTAAELSLAYQREVLDASPVDVFVASNRREYWWPYRLQHIGIASTAIYERAERAYILDSNIGDDDVTNADILDCAEELTDGSALTPTESYIIPKDYIGDRKRTTESVRDFVAAYRARSQAFRDAWTPIIPLQPPHDEHFETLRAETDATSITEYVAIGGIARSPPIKQIRAIERARRVVPETYRIHGLGLGCSLSVVRALRAAPDALDSIDLQTPEQIPRNGRAVDRYWRQYDQPVPRGRRSSVLRSLRAGLIATRLAYEIGSLVNVEKEPHLDVTDADSMLDAATHTTSDEQA